MHPPWLTTEDHVVDSGQHEEPPQPPKRSAWAEFVKRLSAIPVIVGIIFAGLGGVAWFVSLFARTRSQAIFYTVAAVGGVLLSVAVVLLVYVYVRTYATAAIRTRIGILAAAFILVMAASTGVSYLIGHKGPARATGASTDAVRGSITSPSNGAENVCQNKTLNASGTVFNIRNGHRLWLFLYVASANNGAGLYYPGDQGPLSTNGLWAGGAVYIGGTGQPGQRLTLWLADLGPQGFDELGVNNPGPSPGFATLQYAPDVTPLDSVTFTTMTCVSPAPASTPPGVIFNDKFCNTAGGWTVGGGQAGGHYSTCAFRIYAEAHGIAASEPRIKLLYPATPSGIEIDVTARRIVGSAEGDEFGVVCRANSEGYAFLAQSDLAEIFKYSSSTGIIGSPLAAVPAKIDMNASNQLRVTCATDRAGDVHLALWVNGKRLADATDTNDPIPSGTVGLFAATSPTTQTPTVAEFQNFVVLRL